MQNYNGNTPWMIAVQSSNIQMLVGLLELYPIDLSKQNQQGNTMLHLLVEGNQFHLLELLAAKAQASANLSSLFAVHNNERLTPLHLAAMYGQEELPSLMEKFDIQPALAAQDTDGNTPLHRAAQFGHLPLISWLIARGADPNRANAHG